MKEEHVTLCVFHDYAQAREMADRLNEAGIPTFFSGEAASTAGGGFAPAVVTIRLEVPESCLDRACAVLNAEVEQAGVQEEHAVGVPGEGLDDEEEKYEEAAPSPLKSEARFVTGPLMVLDKLFALLESTRPPEEPGKDAPYNIWGPLIVVGFSVLVLLWMMLRIL